MKISRVGGLIAAANQHAAVQTLQIGAISVVQRLVITFQQAGIFPIVIVTGAETDAVRSQLAGYGVIFLPQPDSNAPMLQSVQLGLQYLQEKCDRIAFSPVNVPMFTPNTLQQMLQTAGRIVTPVCDGRGGHPILLSASVIPDILAYDGPEGLRGALHMMEEQRVRVPVEDKGILYSIHNASELHTLLHAHNHAILHPNLAVTIEKEQAFFSTRVKLLLYLIDDTHNMRAACEHMALSLSKAWELVNALEREVGYPIVERRRGGRCGGTTSLTAKGIEFLQTYQIFEEELFRYAQMRFRALFGQSDLLESSR